MKVNIRSPFGFEHTADDILRSGMLGYGQANTAKGSSLWRHRWRNA